MLVRGLFRGLLRGDFVQRRLRDKAIRVVREAVQPGSDEQLAELHRLRGEVTHLREDLNKLANEQTGQTQRVLDWLFEYEVRARRDIVYAADQTAARDSAALVHERMLTAERFADPYRTLEYALSQASGSGMALEFGVYSGTTLKMISDVLAGNEVYGFDSFEGLPEAWRTGFDAGHFDVHTLPDVGSAELVVGWFDETLPGFLSEHPGPVAFLHVDSDLYSSARTVLGLVGPRLGPGSIVVFDEYFNYPGWHQHEYRAWQEHVEHTGLEYSYLAYTYSSEQVVIRIDAI